MDELVFEELGFRSLCVADSPSLVHLYEARRRHSRSQYSLVVDCGFSFTHAAPEVHNFTLNYGIRCLDLCGKALTNYLKELVSYRSVNLMDETLIIDHAKEKLCFVSLDVSRDLRLASDPPNDNEENMGKTPSSARHTRGCNCKKSLCLKKYCECYQAGVGCSFGCRCEGCKNTFGRRDGKFSFSGRSLHHIGDTLNPYEQVISIIGRTLSTFDEDNLIPCFGFGDDHVMDFKML